MQASANAQYQGKVHPLHVYGRLEGSGPSQQVVGSVIAYDYRISRDAHQTPPSLKRRVEVWLAQVWQWSNLSHAGIGFENPQEVDDGGDQQPGPLLEAHLMGPEGGGYQHGDRGLVSWMQKMHFLRLNSFIPGETQEEKGASRVKLQQLYGDQWEAHLQQMFQEVLYSKMEAQGEDNFGHLVNEDGRRIKAAVKLDYVGAGEDGPGAQADGLPEQKEAICSEFVAKSLLLSLNEVNRTIAQEWRKKRMIDEPPVLKSPVSEGRDLSAVLPKDIIDRLRATDFISGEGFRPQVMGDVIDLSKYG
jgi:hypothetical protein